MKENYEVGGTSCSDIFKVWNFFPNVSHDRLLTPRNSRFLRKVYLQLFFSVIIQSKILVVGQTSSNFFSLSHIRSVGR